MAGPGRPRCAAVAVTMAPTVVVLAAGCSGGPAKPRMTAAAASSPSLARIRADERRLTEANKPVEQAVAIIRSQLGLPSPETS